MKIKIKSTKNDDFSPVTVSLEINDIRELRLLFHVLNRFSLLDVLKTQVGCEYNFNNYNEGVAGHFATGIDAAAIKQEIESQGFEL